MREGEVLSLSNTYSNLRGRERGSGGFIGSTGRLVIVGSPTESVLRLPSRIRKRRCEDRRRANQRSSGGWARGL